MSVKITTRDDLSTVVEGAEKDWLRYFRADAQGGTVQIWVSVRSREDGQPDIEALQYLTPLEAMTISKAFERLAIHALRESA